MKFSPAGAPGFGIVKLVLTKAVLSAIFRQGWQAAVDQHICHLKGGKYVVFYKAT